MTPLPQTLWLWAVWSCVSPDILVMSRVGSGGELLSWLRPVLRTCHRSRSTYSTWGHCQSYYIWQTRIPTPLLKSKHFMLFHVSFSLISFSRLQHYLCYNLLFPVICRSGPRTREGTKSVFIPWWVLCTNARHADREWEAQDQVGIPFAKSADVTSWTQRYKPRIMKNFSTSEKMQDTIRDFAL